MVKLFPSGARAEFVDLVCAGVSVLEASRRVGAVHATGGNWWAQSGLMMTLNRGAVGGLADPAPSAEGPGRALGLGERGMIQMGVLLGLSYAKIGELIGRDKSVVWREVKRHRSADGKYYASVAHAKAHQDRRRPKPFKLVQDEDLCRLIGVWMDDGWSPKLISSMLAHYFVDDQTMQVSHETIYQALYVQTRGNLRADLAEKLSLKRKQRVPHTSDRRKNSPYGEAFKISQRPPEVQDRAVPGHWEGDLIIGTDGTAIGTLVERSTRFTILLHLPGDHTAETVAAAMIREMASLPDHLRRSITWDRGTELADYAKIQTALETTLYFCDPHSPWQRGTNENTNRLLRFWFEKGTDLSVHTPEDLRLVAAKLNRRPRPTLNLETPANRLNQLLQAA
ncbi:IS30 family transposase [Arthrobacter sp. 18067]|uniref:IS30 family transposase n=1 Tax=Arthrobacter sp. 18067 TaxID=2681413 RepID=UPI00135A512F|nr:IS30 family transposase [Arthrobacter sp. 18067]